jgi:GTPase-associated system helical domain
MTKFVFADRYAEEGLSPSAEIVASRAGPAERIISAITEVQSLTLVGLYYGATDLDLGWFRDEFIKDDASFSLVNNEREARVLAATILEALVVDEVPHVILGLVAGSVNGHRMPVQSKRLIHLAHEMMGKYSVDERKPSVVETKVTSTLTAKLGEEIGAIGANDWAALLTMLTKIRNESQSSARTTSTQATNALTALNRQVALLREESQMLWWLVGGHSRTLERSFANFGQQQSALIGAVDLGDLTSISFLGPVAASAMLERIIVLAKRSKGAVPRDLASAVDGVAREDLQRLNISPNKVPARLAPITTAIELARTIGPSVWHGRFLETTGLQATIEFEPIELATQLYREHLLGQLT